MGCRNDRFQPAIVDEQCDFAVAQRLGRPPSLSTSGETLTIEESMTLRARTENAGHVGDEHEWLVRSCGLVLFSDEVYRELEHDPQDRLPAACDLDERAVSLGSISKSYGLPGLRIGWLVTRDASLREVMLRLKDYTTICSSAPSELLTAIALRNRHVLLKRNLEIVERNLPLLDRFFERHAETFDWTRPTASPIGFPRVNDVQDVDGFCERLASMGVLLLPGSVYDQPAHVRIGFGRADMPEALRLLEEGLEVTATPRVGDRCTASPHSPSDPPRADGVRRECDGQGGAPPTDFATIGTHAFVGRGRRRIYDSAGSPVSASNRRASVRITLRSIPGSVSSKPLNTL